MMQPMSGYNSKCIVTTRLLFFIKCLLPSQLLCIRCFFLSLSLSPRVFFFLVHFRSLHLFMKRFYEEFRRRVRNPESNGNGRPPPPKDGRPPPPATPKPTNHSDRGSNNSSSGGAGGGGSTRGGGERPPRNSAGGSKAAPARPGSLRTSICTDTTVTLTWDARGADEKATAYELQWRAKGEGSRSRDDQSNSSASTSTAGAANRSVSEWETSNQLILGTTCRKKNLTPQTCYEFRVRAASAFGWSGYAEPLLVVTLPSDSAGRSAAEQEAAAKAARAKVAERGRHQSSAKEAKSSKSSSSSSSSSGGVGGGSGSVKEPRPPSQHLQTTARMTGTGWQCVVCKRPNERGQGQCRTCFTKRSYIANKVRRLLHV